MPPDRPHPPIGTNRPTPLIHPFEAMPCAARRADDRLTPLTDWNGVHDVDVSVDHPRHAVRDGARHVGPDHPAEGPYLALRVPDLPAVPMARRRPDPPDAAGRERSVRRADLGAGRGGVMLAHTRGRSSR